MGTADRIAYVNHDIDDAIRTGILRGPICRIRPIGCSAPTTRPASNWSPTWCAPRQRRGVSP